MKNKELFNKTVNILVKAYQNDTLEHRECYACAVGNIIAANMFDNFEEWKNYFEYTQNDWSDVFCTTINGQMFNLKNYKWFREPREQIDSTGYSPIELAKIEYAFETAEKGNSKDEHMFNGLVAVYNILSQIHQVEDEEIKKPELIFVKA